MAEDDRKRFMDKVRSLTNEYNVLKLRIESVKNQLCLDSLVVQGLPDSSFVEVASGQTPIFCQEVDKSNQQPLEDDVYMYNHLTELKVETFARSLFGNVNYGFTQHPQVGIIKIT